MYKFVMSISMFKLILLLRLHKEICDFYEFVKPQRFEQIVREDLLRRLSNVIKDIRPDCELACFGSFAAGLYLPNADMDLVVNSVGYLRGGYKDAFQSSTEMYQLGRLLKSIAVAEPDSIEVIPKARVPLIKFVDRVTSLKIDLSFENNSGTEANGTFQEWKAAFPAMPIIVTLIKQFLMMRGLSDVANGGLGGFSVTCLVTSLLQNMPRIHTGALIPEQHLGEILLEFLDLYGNQLDISRTAISMRPPGYVEKVWSDPVGRPMAADSHYSSRSGTARMLTSLANSRLLILIILITTFPAVRGTSH